MKKSTRIFRDGTHKCLPSLSLGTKLRMWCSRLTGIDPVAPDAVLLNEPFFD